jgi:hypothetical protein
MDDINIMRGLEVELVSRHLQFNKFVLYLQQMKGETDRNHELKCISSSQRHQ